MKHNPFAFYGKKIQGGDPNFIGRNAEISYPRQIAMYLIRTMTDTPLKSVGIVLGGKDHATIKHGVDKIAALVLKDEILSNTINILKKKIGS